MKFKDRKYLRKKSLRIQEYLLFGLTGAALYLMFSRYNSNINPADKIKEKELQSQNVHPAEYFFEQTQKWLSVVRAYRMVDQYNAYNEKEQAKTARQEEAAAKKEEKTA